MVKVDLERFRSIRARTLAMVQGLSQAQMDYSPTPDKWSVSEVADHLILSEKIARADIAELIERTKAGRRPVLYRSFADFNATAFFIPKGVLPFFETPFNFLNLFVPNGVRDFFLRCTLIPARTADAATPRRGRSAVELLDELRSSLEGTEALLAANPNLDYGKMVRQHPLLGTHNVPQLLHILGLHEQRHQAQISDLLTDPQFPVAGRQAASYRTRDSM
jgi:hypothetical protein